ATSVEKNTLIEEGTTKRAKAWMDMRRLDWAAQRGWRCGGGTTSEALGSARGRPASEPSFEQLRLRLVLSLRIVAAVFDGLGARLNLIRASKSLSRSLNATFFDVCESAWNECSDASRSRSRCHVP